MKFRSAYLASIVTAATMAFAVPAAAQQTDWTKRVTVSAKGGHIMGNPLAKHRITEYMSYTCNHCANFEAQSYVPLKSNFIKKGHISFEIRNLVLNPFDMTAAILARCGGRTKFFGNHRAFLSQQESWMETLHASPAVMKSLNTGPIIERLKRISRAADFYGLMKKRGYSEAKVNTCLADQSAQNKILAMTKYATQTLKLSGTPSFTHNGKVIDKVYNWARLQRKLDGLSQ